MYALDTSTVVNYFRGRGQVAARLLALSPREILLPTIVLYELELGVEKSEQSARRRDELDGLARVIRLLPFGPGEARVAARIRAQLESEGRRIGPYDTLIAATALAHGAVLVTHNVDEFRRVDGLEIEDWT
jgi:tRNA(fMet)-specific endonuclease VapC